jgi:PAS domain S-box-containing protein
MRKASQQPVVAPGLLQDFSDDAQFRLLVQGVTDYAIYMLDTHGCVSNWNPGGERIKGYRRDEIIGQHFSRFYTEEDRAAGEPERGLRAAREEGRYEREGWRMRKDGTRFRASVVIDPIWQGDQLMGYAKVTRDITDRYEAQLRLEDAQKVLAQSQKMEAVGKLTLGLAHDFNNLLTVIINSLDLLQARHEGDERSGRLIEGATRAADRGALLTRQLLTFARGQNLAPEIHDINQLLRSTEALFRRACDTHITLGFEFAEALPQILVDPAQFEAAILNLVINARDAMEAGGRVTITTALVQSRPPADLDAVPAPYICVEVADNGSGMAPELLERVVEPFFTTKTVGKGSGLGLSQVYGFASQSAGFMRMESEPGVGTRVFIYLPVGQA